MEWPLRTAERELVDACTYYIENNNVLGEHKILIWGASVRGTVLGILLEKYGYSEFQYVDNDKRKWGENINGHIIVSPESVKKKISEFFVIVPIEYGDEIRIQLEEWGLVEEKNFKILQAKINDKYVEEFFRKYTNKRLVLGETFLNEIVFDEKKAISIKERIWETFGKENTKVLSLNCMGMQSYYHMLRLQINLGYKPEELWLFISYETLTEFHHILSRTQHVGVLNAIQSQSNIEDEEFFEYIKVAKERATNFSIELQYSPQRTTNNNIMNMEEIRKAYMQLNLLYEIKMNSEEINYLIKILQITQLEKIDTYCIMTPINYELARKYYDTEFEKYYNDNNAKLRMLVTSAQAKFYDMGMLLSEKNFVALETINDGIYGVGQEKVIQFLCNMNHK